MVNIRWNIALCLILMALTVGTGAVLLDVGEMLKIAVIVSFASAIIALLSWAGD